jgi:multisubunit Na+/H+ antiporter MnhC subunit
MILIILGLLSLFGQIFRGFPFLNYLWPFIIVGFGGLFFVGMLAGGKSLAGLAIPGTIISGLGLMMFIQNLTGYWESWAYSWTIILVLVGLGIFIMGLYTEDTHHRQAGLRVMKVGAILFIIFGGFFELIFNAFRPYGIQQYLFPLLLVALGVYLVVVRSGLISSRQADSNNPTINLSEEKK